MANSRSKLLGQMVFGAAHGKIQGSTEGPKTGCNGADFVTLI